MNKKKNDKINIRISTEDLSKLKHKALTDYERKKGPKKPFNFSKWIIEKLLK